MCCDALITDHAKEEIDMVCEWIKSKLIRIKTPNYDKSSYSLKHIFEKDTGLYLTNNEFKDAMLMCGYEPVNPNDLNWNYCLSGEYEGDNMVEKEFTGPIYEQVDDAYHFILRHINLGAEINGVYRSEELKHSFVSMGLDVKEYAKLMEFLSVPRTRQEIQEFCGYKSRDYFRKNILAPLIEAGKVDMTIPEKPKSSKQKYVKHTKR